MRIALLGGTFNPIHTGHLLIAETARQDHHLDRVVFVPAGLPPHKGAPKTLARDRLAMVRLAIHGNPSFEISDWEIRQKRVVYTVETLEHFHQTMPRASLFFIIGSDSLKDLPRWRNYKRLKTLCRFITLDRILPFASHDIRAQVRKGESIRYQVPDAVDRYIRRHRLYRQPE